MTIDQAALTARITALEEAMTAASATIAAAKADLAALTPPTDSAADAREVAGVEITTPTAAERLGDAEKPHPERGEAAGGEPRRGGGGRPRAEQLAADGPAPPSAVPAATADGGATT